MPEKPPYFRLSFFYLSYFTALGCFIPYWPVYLQEQHFTSIQIGQIMGIFMLSKFLAPLVWGWITDASGKRLKWIRIASFLTILGIFPLFYQQSYAWIAFATLIFGFFWNASLPQFEVITLNSLGDNASKYSWVRLWGSIGFIIAVVCLPLLFRHLSINSLPVIIMIIFIIIWLSTWLIKDKPHRISSHLQQADFWYVMRQPMVIALLLVCILQTASHGAYYTFFSIYLEDQGYSQEIVGWMWALGVLAEVVLFVFAYRLFTAFKVSHLFALSILLTAIRWILLATVADHLTILWLTQLLHAASYGLFHASAIHLIHEWFPGSLQGRGQAMYAALSYGLGGAIGSVMSGYLWELTHSTYTFLVMAVIATIAWLVAIIFISTKP